MEVTSLSGNLLFSLYMMLNKFINEYLVRDIDIKMVEEDMKSRWGSFWKNHYSYQGMRGIISHSWRSIAAESSTGIYIPGQIYLGLDCLPEIYLFNMMNPFMSGLIIKTYKDLHGYYPDINDEFSAEVCKKIEEILTSQHYWGFWLPSTFRPRAKNRIISKEFKIQNIWVHPESIKVNLFEINRKILIPHPEEYKLFPSIELQDEYRKKLEENWLGYYDITMAFFDRKIEYLKNKIRRLKSEKKRYSNSYEEYKNRIKRQIWNN